MLILWLPACINDRLRNAKPGECIWEPSLNKEFVVVVAIIGHHGSCFVMLFCYLKVFIFMHNRGRVMASESRGKSQKVEVSVLENELDSFCVQSKHFGAYNTSMFVASEISQVQPLSPEACGSQENQLKAVIRSDCLEMPISKQLSKPSDETISNPKPSKVHRHKRDRAIFITLSYVVMGYAVCWIPFHVVFDISALCPSCVPRGVYAITFWMTYINSAVNPFLYNFSTPEFRRTFRKLLLRR